MNLIDYMNTPADGCGMTINEVIEAGYLLHHTALHCGYQTVKRPHIEPYSGVFGEGYKVERNNPQSSQYKIVEYYIK